jgi:chromosome segregation protein
MPPAIVQQTMGPLADFIRVEQGFKDVADALLANVLVVKDLPTAIRLQNEDGYRGAFVTLDGEVLDNAGTITGGQTDALTTGLIQKKREIAELADLAALQEEAFKKTEREFYIHEGLIAKLQETINQTQKALDENHIALSEAAGDLRRLNQEVERLRAEHAAGAGQRERLTQQHAAMAHRHEQERRELHGIERALEAARHAADDKTAAQRALAAEIDACQKAVTEALLLVNNLRQEQRNAAARRDNRLHSKDEAAGLVARRAEQMQQARETQDAHRHQIAALTQGLVEKIAGLEAAEREAVQVREGVDAKIAQVEQNENGIKLLRRDLDGYDRELHAADLTASQLSLKREHLAEKLREKYQVELDALPEPSDEVEMDTEALKTRAQEIAARITQMGEVNPNAVEEYATEKARLDQYVTQKDDLESAIDELKKAIAKINKTSKERFQETFELVSHKFSEVMPVLFGGGVAKLVLTEPDDPLESGIDIVVRPPGKKLTNVNLLSGGEKALASIGLVFSIFLVKPSPFCLLDEVDAPLDDANIYRFNKLIEQMAARSQVLLITHNKATMEVADRLYGVTMQEKGVSKLVSVQLLQEEPAN